MHAVNWPQISPLSCVDWQAALRSQSLLLEKWQKMLINSWQTVDYATDLCRSCRRRLAGASERTNSPPSAAERAGCWRQTAGWSGAGTLTAFLKLCPLLSAAGINRMESSWILSESPAAVMSKSRVVVAGACRLARSATPWCWRGAQPYI